MKKAIFAIVIAIVVCPFCAPKVAVADTDNYVKITSKSALFYERADTGSFVIFQIVKGCFAKIIGQDGDFWQVSYMGVQGYVSRSDVDTQTYSNLTFTGNAYWHEPITFTLSSGAILSAEPGGKRALNGVDLSREFSLLGVVIHDGREYACTLVGTAPTDYAYVAVSQTSWMPTLNAITAPTVYVAPTATPILPTPSMLPSDTDTTVQPTIDTEKDQLVKLLLILGISVPVVIVLVLIFRPAKSSYGRYGDAVGRSMFEDFDASE